MAIVMAPHPEAAAAAAQPEPPDPGDLEAVILRCLEKDPARRFAEVSEIQEALTSISSEVEAA